MSNYTVTLKTIIDSGFDLGLNDYPIYKEEYRIPLNNLIKEHFMFREIGVETPQLFKFYLNRKMNEIMPYYNQLYKSEDVEFNPLWNVEMYEDFEQEDTRENTTVGTNTNVSNQTSTNTKVATNNNTDTKTGTNNSTNIVDSENTNNQTLINENLKFHDDTPASGMNIDDVKNNMFASSIERENSNNTNNNTLTNNETTTFEGSENVTSTFEGSENITDNGTNNINDTLNTNVTDNMSSNGNYHKKTYGASAGYSFSQLITQWRNIMLNINMQIVEELEPLFMQIF